MKTIAIILVLVAVATAQRFGPTHSAHRAGGNIGGPGVGGIRSQALVPVTFGANVYGPAARSILPFSPLVPQIRQAERIAKSFPGTLVYVGLDGEVEFRNRFGDEHENPLFELFE